MTMAVMTSDSGRLAASARPAPARPGVLQRAGAAVSLAADLARDLVRMRRGPLPVALQNAVLRTQARLYGRSLLSGRTHGKVDCRVLDARFATFSVPTLSFLVRETFIDLDYYFETPSAAPLILDCGSNIGMSILFFKTLYPQATVIGFEPATGTFDLLQQNVGGLAGVQLHRAAAGAIDGDVDFFESPVPGSPTASTNVHRSGTNRTTVPQVRLSRFIDRDVDFLKLDVEGAEWGVMADLIESGRIRRIAQMVIEYHHHVEAEDRLAEFLLQLEQQRFGYQVRAYLGSAWRRGTFQDVLIYAYRKD